jgi:hypothetical protein
MLTRDADRRVLLGWPRQGAVRSAAVVLLTMACGGGLVAAAFADAAIDEAPTASPTATAPPSGAYEGASSESSSLSAALRLREGTQFADRLGHFRQQGESVVFVDDQGRELGGLPNLNLERVLRMLKGVEEPDSIAWSVSGTVTEYGGRNYLLITRAVYKSATLPPAPDLVE